jgi:hypothetical protein
VKVVEKVKNEANRWTDKENGQELKMQSTISECFLCDPAKFNGLNLLCKATT